MNLGPPGRYISALALVVSVMIGAQFFDFLFNAFPSVFLMILNIGAVSAIQRYRPVRRMQRERQKTFLKGRDNLLAREGAGTTVAFRKNANIARRGRDRIALADNVPDGLDPGGELANMLASFLGIGIEQPGAGMP